MLDRSAALAAAAAFLAEEPEDHEVRTIPERAFTDGTALIVPYGSVASLDHGRKDMERPAAGTRRWPWRRCARSARRGWPRWWSRRRRP